MHNPTRQEALLQLARFLPTAGLEYARGRNFDYERTEKNKVSRLSPYLRHRLLLEEEVYEQVLSQHREKPAEKFLQEVLWRTYWKGWLELRPQVWRDFLSTKDALLNEISGAKLDRYERAILGDTHIACFNHWIRQLSETGYLHNHARMWFASIWIYTFQLPWQLGADLFYQQLLDGDPASNTLSWRWVAGLQTKGKQYLASAENIKKFTGGQFFPENILADRTFSIEDSSSIEICLKSLGRIQHARSNFPEDSDAFLLHEEDLCPETQEKLRNFLTNRNVRVILLPVTSNKEVSQKVRQFKKEALADAKRRIENLFSVAVFEAPETNTIDSLLSFFKENDLNSVSYLFSPLGPTQDFLSTLGEKGGKQDIHFHEIFRDWDKELYPLAKKGFFPFKQSAFPRAAQLLGDRE